jgi:uncharacterized phage protein (TIGR02218 family)
MSYDSKELSVQDSAPVMLYQFAQDETVFRYTSAASAITRLTYSWTPAALAVSNFVFTGEMPRDAISIKLPRDNALAVTFLGYSPDAVTTVTIYRTHADDTDTQVYWKGRVSSAVVSRNEVTLDCEAIFSSLRRIGLRESYQRTCRHALFGSGCYVLASDWDQTATVTAIVGNVLTVTEADGMDDIVGGTFEAPDGTIRMITAHEGTSVTLLRPIRSLVTELEENPTGFEAIIRRGCDHSIGTCQTVFDNAGNFGGFPGLPGSNPMGGDNVF